MQYIKLRDLETFLYCPKRWGLIELNCDWKSNAFVVIGEIIHKRVDDPSLITYYKDKIVERAIPVYNKKYGLYGKIDSLELHYSKNGTYVEKYDNYFLFKIIEFKKKQPNKGNYNLDDAVQIYGQKLCIDEMFQTDCQMNIYYGNTKNKYQIILNSEIENAFKFSYNGIKSAMKTNKIPDIKKGQYCSGCSMKDICIPKSYKIKKNFKELIKKENEKTT